MTLLLTLCRSKCSIAGKQGFGNGKNFAHLMVAFFTNFYDFVFFNFAVETFSRFVFCQDISMDTRKFRNLTDCFLVPSFSRADKWH